MQKQAADETVRRTTSSRRSASAVRASALVAGGLVVVCAAAGAGWWLTIHHRRSVAEAADAQVRAVGEQLAGRLADLLSDGELALAQATLRQVARQMHLSDARVTLPDGRSVAAQDGRPDIDTLPDHWAGQAPLAPPKRVGPGRWQGEFAILVPGRGEATLAARFDDLPEAGWSVPLAAALAGGVPLAALLGSAAALRKRFRGASAVQAALLEAAEGPLDLQGLHVDQAIGTEAAGWNRLLEELQAARLASAVQRARESLSEQQAPGSDLAGAFNAMSQGVILLDDSGRVKCGNGAAAKFLGVPSDGLVGKSVVELIADEQAREVVAAGIAPEGSRRAVVVSEQAEGEHTTALRFSLRPVRKEDRAAAMLTIEDITQQLVADRARNGFVAQATHELRTPLTNIRLYVETAIEEGEDDAAIRAQCLNVINQETRRLERMVGELLSVSEMEAGSLRLHRDDVALAALFEELEKDYGPQASEKAITLRFDLPPKLPTIQADRDKFCLAVHNVLGNALKYTPDSGEVTVRAEVEPNQLTVKVTDTGIGICEADRERIFETFYRAGDERVDKITGSGLGLALARQVMRLHGGDIIVDSELDKGSTFTMLLPVQVEEAA